ncbi:MAG: type VI secretion system protein, partial [Massilia sp.]
MSLRMVLLLVGLVFALIALLLVLRAARGRAQRTQAPAASRRASGAHRDNAARRLDRIAQEAFSTITAFLPDTLQRYDVPLVMLAGDAGSGKSSMLENSGLSAVATREQGTAGELRWHHFDQGVVLEVGASYLGIDSLPGQQVPAWNGLGSAMQRYRPRRPVDAIVLTVGADALAGSLEDLELDAEQLQRRLSEMQVQFGLRLPVYLVVTKADLLDDFAPMVAALPASLRNGMLGWSSPYGTAMSYDPSWVGEAFDAIDDTVAELSCEIMAGARPPAGKPGMLGAAQSIAALQVPLRAYLSRLMSAQSHTQPLLLRGIYLCSSAANQPAFVRDLMACKVFAERGMAQPLPGQVWSRDRRVSRWRWATAILILLWLPMLCMADWRLRRVAPDLLATLVQVKNDVGEVRRIRAQGGYVPTAFIRNASDGIVKAMLNRAESLGSYSIPFSWHLWNQSTLDDKVEERFRDGISEIVLPALGKSFNEQVHDLTGARLDPISTRVVQGQGCPPASKEAPASLALDSGIDASGSFVALSDYVDQLALLEHHLREFDELQQHNSGTIDEFAELGKYTKTFRISDAERRANPRYFKQALNKVQVDSGALPSKADYLVVLQCGLQQRHDALMATLLERHPLLLYADAVDARMHGALPAHEYDELKSDLNDLKLWLGAPSSNWLHARRLDFGKPYVDLLAKVDALGLFEPKRGPALRAQAEQKLRNMDGKLLAARVSSSPVLQRSADGARLQMSPPVAHLESLLTVLMEQPFMAPIGQRPHHTSGGRATLWDLGELNAMLVQVEEQNRYLQQ